MAANGLKYLVVQGPAGLNYFTKPELAFAEIVKVSRESKVYYKVSGTPADNEFKHTTSAGKIEFLNPFNFAVHDPDGSRQIEYVYIIYKRGGDIVVEPPTGPGGF